MESQHKKQKQESALPISELDKALLGILGTPKSEVEAEEKRERRKARRNKGLRKNK